MKVSFFGASHAARHLKAAALEKGFEVCVPHQADLLFVSEDTPTDETGKRDLSLIRRLVQAAALFSAPLVVTSQVEPGFTRSLGLPCYHQAETLRILDAAERARNPEMLIVGAQNPAAPLPAAYAEYLRAFACPILLMSWEEAEFAKVAINATLAAQVENTNRLAAAAERVGARWEAIAEVLRHDRRIGPHAYLAPGRWQDSAHLVRDARTLRAIEGP